MPRPNQPRTIASEAALARRIAHEREAAGMTPAGLASRMTQAGCPINASAIYKIEKAHPPRRITVDELVALSKVFALPVDNLLLPPEVAMSREVSTLVKSWSEAREHVRPAVRRERVAWDALVSYVRANPDTAPHLVPILDDWVVEHFPEQQRRLALGHKMRELTDDPKWIEDLDPADRGVLLQDSEGNPLLSVQAREIEAMADVQREEA